MGRGFKQGLMQPGRPHTHYVAGDDLELMTSCLHLPNPRIPGVSLPGFETEPPSPVKAVRCHHWPGWVLRTRGKEDRPSNSNLRLIEETGTLLLSGGQEPSESGGRDGCWGGKILLPIPETPSALPFREGPATSDSRQASHLSPHRQHSGQKIYVEDKRMTPSASYRTSSPALLTSATGSALGPL